MFQKSRAAHAERLSFLKDADLKNALYNARMGRTKSPEEVLAMEDTQRAAEAAMSAVISYLSSTGMPTAEEAHAIIERVLLEHDCESPEGKIVAGGEQAVEPHERGHGPLKKGEAIVIDIFPRSKKTGYFADMTRTVCIGESPERLRKMYDAVVAAQDLAISMIKPGTYGKDIQKAVEDLFKDLGYETTGKGKEFTYAEGFVHAVGHGVGTSVHEEPRISRRADDVLAEGDVVTVEPGLYYKALGGIRMEDMVLVTKDGCKNLTRYERKFEI